MGLSDKPLIFNHNLNGSFIYRHHNFFQTGRLPIVEKIRILNYFLHIMRQSTIYFRHRQSNYASRYVKTPCIYGKSWANPWHGMLPAMRMGWTLFCLFFWSIVVHWIVLPNMGRFNRLWHMPKLWPRPTIIYVVVIFLVHYHILEQVPLALWFWSLLPNTA